MPVKKALKGLWILKQDLRQTVQGSRAFIRYLLAKNDVDIGIGLFEAASARACTDYPNQYSIRVVNSGRYPKNIVLMVDIYATDVPRHPEGHYAYFSKHLPLGPRASRTVVVEYDWQTEARFCIDNALFPPDDFWRGKVGLPHFYSITALISDVQGTRLGELTIYQEFTG